MRQNVLVEQETRTDPKHISETPDDYQQRTISRITRNKLEKKNSVRKEWQNIRWTQDIDLKFVRQLACRPYFYALQEKITAGNRRNAHWNGLTTICVQ